MFTHTVIRGYRDSSGQTIQSIDSVSTDTENNLEAAIAHNAVNAVIHWSATRANLRALSISSDIAITLKTDDNVAPDDTITVAAGQNIIWSLASDTLANCPFGHDVADIRITGPGTGPDGTLKIRALLHQT